MTLAEREREYITQQTAETMPAMRSEDTMMREMKQEREAAMRIIAKLKKGLKVTDAASELAGGQWWDPGPKCALRSMLREFVP